MSWWSVIPGGGIVKAISGAVQSWQQRKAKKQQAKAEIKQERVRHRGEWELAQAKRATTVARWMSYASFWLPIYYALYLAFQALPAEPTPQDVGDAVESAIDAFPVWWTGAAVSITLAIWGIRESQHGSITAAAMRVQQEDAKAEAERERRQAEESRERQLEARGGPPGSGP